MEEIDNQQQEELLRKVRAKKRVRGLLIFVNVLLASYLVFEVVMKTVDYVSYSLEDNEIITLNGNSKSKSLEIYDKYLVKENDAYKVEEIYDFGIYGGYLNLSKYQIEENKYSSISNVGLINVSQTVFDNNCNKTIEKNYLNGGINLFSLAKGDYLLCQDIVTIDNINGKIIPYKIRSEKGIEKTVFSLPDENGKRTKVVVKSKDSSPSLVISVSETNTLPQDYYDFVLVGEENNFHQFNGYKYKIVDNLLDAFKVKANYAFIYDDVEDILTDKHIRNSNYDDNYLNNYYFNELGGYLTFAGSCKENDKNSFVVKPYMEDHENGKLTLVIKDHSFEEIKKYF